MGGWGGGVEGKASKWFASSTRTPWLVRDSPRFAEDVQHLLSMTDRPEPHLRWTAAQTLDYLGDMYRRHQAGSCLASRHDEIKAALAAAYDSMIRDHAFRCKSRYC